MTPTHRKVLEHQIAELTFTSNNGPVHEAVMYYAGPRCDDYEPECASCKTWRAYDVMFAQSEQFKSMLDDLVEVAIVECDVDD